MRGTLSILLAVLLLTLPAIAFAQVYTWKDSNGTRHFSDRQPPEGIKYSVIKTRANADMPRSASGSDVPSSKDTGNGQADVSAQSSQQADAGQSPQLKRFCAQLQSNITLLKSNQTIASMNKDGKTVQMNDKVRAQQLKQQQQRYQAYCIK
ncbi:DUF4124 domain-containing protein [Oleiagrimonas sp.]|jgi:hypothetical protein|uniref:DUF4124 domain-containing protein n=1 Tax=Oleiagrimonas sp. TaxID=2010330 RepID=UPI0026191012|nr:DUF4124 domain-containing protein [Oleiagrimonas sp.]MDA3915019.1 DUF4124 domain-containing protein [Oleiagrimonas sp.]